MRPLKFRYVWKRKSDGHIWMEITPIECLEGKGDVPFILRDHSEWELISRDEFTGVLDKNGKEIYDRDIVKTIYETTGEVVWYDEKYMEEFTEGGIGVLAGFIIREGLRSYRVISTISEVVGSIYDNPDMFK